MCDRAIQEELRRTTTSVVPTYVMGNEDKLPVRKNIRLEGCDYSSLQAYFITICSLDKKKHFFSDSLNQSIIKCLIEEKKRTNYLIYVYCLMPDHMHMLLRPPGDGISVSQFIGGFKSKTTRIAWNYGMQGGIWQGRFYDHILRKKERMNVIGEYILRKG